MDERINQPEPNKNKEESSVGPLIGILIIALIIVAGGVYFLFLK